jgi:hypothetical protein
VKLLHDRNTTLRGRFPSTLDDRRAFVRYYAALETVNSAARCSPRFHIAHLLILNKLPIF